MLIDLKFIEDVTGDFFKSGVCSYNFSNKSLIVTANDYTNDTTPTFTLAQHMSVKGVYASDNLLNIIQHFTEFEVLIRPISITENLDARLRDFNGDCTDYEAALRQPIHEVEVESGHGIADNIEQILKHPRFQICKNTARLYVLAVKLIRKVDQMPPCIYESWKWERKGDYIGTKKKQHRYLYDETDIEEVLEFQFIEVRPKE